VQPRGVPARAGPSPAGACMVGNCDSAADGCFQEAPEMSTLEEIEAIKRLKYKYFRCLDRKQWDEMAETFTEDAVSSYDSGKYAFEGRDAIMAFLRDALGGSNAISRHHGHHPEIELTSPTTARGVWYLEDYVIFKDSNTALSGAGFYTDEYAKVGGHWLIRSTGYERTYEQVETRESVQHLRTMFDGEC
jgi:hypothetical protein